MNVSTSHDHLQRIAAEGLGHPIVLAGYNAQQRAADMTHRFTQEASFFWATGIDEPGWRAVIEGDVLTLLAPERDETQVLFEGGLSANEAQAISGAQAVVAHDAAERFLQQLAETNKTVYTLGKDPHAPYYHFEENGAQAALTRVLEKTFDEVKDIRPILSKLRAIKTPEEISAIQAAVDVSIAGFEALKEAIAQGATREYELEGILNNVFRSTGAGGHAYDPIIAGGSHACTLHYAVNSDTLPANGLVLVDAGASVHGYAADITRTYAIGTPTDRQKAVHAAVQRAHEKIIDLITPGLTFKEYQQQVDSIMKDALESLGLLTDHHDEASYRKYFPHAVGHGLGLDVHESLGGFGELKPGMVLTVEPGIYIPEEGIGVRIEDDILVTKEGRRNLSEALSTDI